MVYHITQNFEKNRFSYIFIARTAVYRDPKIFSSDEYSKKTTDKCEIILNGIIDAEKLFYYNSEKTSIEDSLIYEVKDVYFDKTILQNRLKSTFVLYLALSYIKNNINKDDIIIYHQNDYASFLTSGKIRPEDPHEIEISKYLSVHNIIYGDGFQHRDINDRDFWDLPPEIELVSNIEQGKPFGYLCPELYEGTGYIPPTEPLRFRQITSEELKAKQDAVAFKPMPVSESDDEVVRFKKLHP